MSADVIEIQITALYLDVTALYLVGVSIVAQGIRWGSGSELGHATKGDLLPVDMSQF